MKIISMLYTNYYESAAVILFSIGFAMLFLQRNLIKKVMGLNIMDTSIFLFLASKGYIKGRGVPIINKLGEVDTSKYINPIPSSLVLTGIVFTVTISAILLALTQRFYEYYGTTYLDDSIFKD